MSINLSGYSAVGVCLCVRIDIPGSSILRISTFHKYIDIVESDGYTYQYSPAGDLMSISESISELRASSVETSIGITGIPLAYAQGIQEVRIKGSRVQVRRVFTDPTTDLPLNIAGNPVFMFQGIVTNYGFSETVNEWSQDSSLIINLSCSSLVDMLMTKITGRRTNQESMSQYYPSDSSFNRITNLIGRPFDFGAPVMKTAEVSAGSTAGGGQDNNVIVERF